MNGKRPDKLIMMANQIAAFFAGQHGHDQAQRVAEHLRAFWDPQMRRELIAWAEGGGEGLAPLALRAVSLLPGPVRLADDAG